MLERGRHVSPSEFVEDEAVQYARLYSDGALQLSRDFSFQVLQGMCVGGSTVVNNGVCFDIPTEVLARWNAPPFDAGLPVDMLQRSLREVRQLIGAGSQVKAPGNPIAARMPGGRAASGHRQPRRMRRLRVLQHRLLVQSQALDAGRRPAGHPAGGRPPPRARSRSSAGGSRSCPAARCPRSRIAIGAPPACARALRLPDGGHRKLVVDAETVVLSAGAIHSSRILMQSGIGGPRVGRGLAANLGSHMTAFWPGW